MDSGGERKCFQKIIARERVVERELQALGRRGAAQAGEQIQDFDAAGVQVGAPIVPAVAAVVGIGEYRKGAPASGILHGFGRKRGDAKTRGLARAEKREVTVGQRGFGAADDCYAIDCVAKNGGGYVWPAVIGEEYEADICGACLLRDFFG